MIDRRTQELFEAARKATSENPLTEAYEPALVALLARIRELAPAQQQDFEGFLIEQLAIRTGQYWRHLPWEMVSFLMYALRWSSVRAFCELQASTHVDSGRALRWQGRFARILESFEDDWDDRVLFASYRTGKDPDGEQYE